MNCNNLCVIVYTDIKENELIVKNKCGKILFYGRAKEKYIFLIPKKEKFIISAKNLKQGLKSTKFYFNISPCVSRIVVRFNLNFRKPQSFLLYDSNYYLPVPLATIYFKSQKAL